jgi:hypothetical protein
VLYLVFFQFGYTNRDNQDAIIANKHHAVANIVNVITEMAHQNVGHVFRRRSAWQRLGQSEFELGRPLIVVGGLIDWTLLKFLLRAIVKRRHTDDSRECLFGSFAMSR